MQAAPVRVQAVEWLLREALSNLVDNAIRYTARGSEVTVKVHAEGGHAWLVVEDNGPGMSAEDIARASVRFRRGAAGKNKSGAGLGLAIVRTIIEIHGGQLVLETASRSRVCARHWCFPLGFKGNAALPHEIVVI